MKIFLSIGEVSKIKGISHRMLRYYDKLGILVPAFVNEENGYRYYSKSQMVILDLIFVCTDLGIPLSQFQSFMLDNNTYDIEKMLEVGEELALKKLKQINDNIFRLNSLKKTFIQDDISYKGIVKKHFNKRYFLVEAFDMNKFSIESYWESLSRIYKKTIKYDFTPSINQGQCFFYTDKDVKVYTYIEIDKPKIKNKDVLTICSGEFDCEIFEDEDMEIAQKKYFTSHPSGTIMVVADVIEKHISDKILPFEVQILRK